MATRVATKRIDVDTHFFPRIDLANFKDLLPRGMVNEAMDRYQKDVERATDGDRIRAVAKGRPVPDTSAPDPHRDPEERVKFLPSTGFDSQVLLPDRVFGNLYGSSPSGGDLSKPIRVALSKLYNDAALAAQQQYPDNFLGVITVPWDDLDETTAEVERAAKRGLKAVFIPANWIGKNFDTMELYPFWEVVNEHRLPVFVHHIPQGCTGRTTVDHQPLYHMMGMERMRRLHIGTYLGFGLEYTLAIAALTIGGVMDEFPNLRFCFFEAGASWLPYASLGCERSSFIEPQCARNSTPPSELIRERVLTAIEPVDHMEALVTTLGNEMFFFGTDFPHPEYLAYENTTEAVLSRDGLAEDTKDAILGGNIGRMLGID